MAVHAQSPWERVFDQLRAEYHGRIDPDLLSRTLRLAYQHAEHLDMLRNPRLLYSAVREFLDAQVDDSPGMRYRRPAPDGHIRSSREDPADSLPR
ncbi:MAG TPA: hypothetical protein VFU43_29545 [Streptosporangiaceae bacterium]|nr:hypothetical protein [Streptosporangiaceae bacterium]